jgi:hypothetical protein
MQSSGETRSGIGECIKGFKYKTKGASNDEQWPERPEPDKAKREWVNLPP